MCDSSDSTTAAAVAAINSIDSAIDGSAVGSRRLKARLRPVREWAMSPAKVELL